MIRKTSDWFEGVFRDKLKEIGFSSVETTYREMLEAVVIAKK